MLTYINCFYVHCLNKNNDFNEHLQSPTGWVMISKQHKLTFKSEFDSHWGPHLYGLVPHHLSLVNYFNENLQMHNSISHNHSSKIGFFV